MFWRRKTDVVLNLVHLCCICSFKEQEDMCLLSERSELMETFLSGCMYGRHSRDNTPQHVEQTYNSKE